MDLPPTPAVGEDVGRGWGWYKQKLVGLAKMVTIEPAIFMMTFSWGLSNVINQNLIIDKVCRDFEFPASVCKDIDSHEAEEDQVQTRVSQLNMTLNMMGAIPSIILALFIGPWSDRNGRKPIMLIPLIGYLASTLVWFLNVCFKEAPANYLIGTCISSFFGGFTCLLIGMYSYLADITSVQARTTRIAILDIFMFGGMPGGVFISAYVFKYFGYFGVYGSVFAIQILTILYIIFFITDTRGPGSQYSYPDSELSHIETSTFRRYLSIVNIHHVFDVFKVTFKKRSNYFRRVILILIALMLLNITIFSDGGVLYLYCRKKFKWNEQQYTKFTTCTIIVSAVAAFIAMPLLSYYWKVHDAMIGILATISKVSSLIVISMANDGWILFFGACLGFLSSLVSIVIRSMLSKCVSKAELGKIYSLLASLEAAVPLFASPLFTFVYTASLETFLGAVFVLQAAIFAFCGLGFVYVFYLLTRSGQDFALLVEEDEDYQESIVRDENSLVT